jgi:antagonist of KipI
LLEALKIVKPGTLATIQDAGRPGLRRYGIPPSGAMDQFSYRLANLLLGRSKQATAAAIEITLGGFIAEALAPLMVAIGGGNLSPQLNNQPAPMWTTLSIERGDRIAFPKRISGCRAYLAVRGGLQAPEFLHSKSVFTKGLMGRPLQMDDVLFLDQPPPQQQTSRSSVRPEYRPDFSPPHTIRVVLGPQSDHFTPRGIESFLSSEYRLSPQSDRQGLRTIGPPIEFATGPDIISDPTPLGAIQIPGDGQPIILHRDGQVTGGYAKIAVVATVDLDLLAQAFPGDVLRFDAISREEAIELNGNRTEEIE